MGFAALISPKPEPFGAKPIDVDWIVDRATVEQTETIASSNMKTKRSIIKRLKKEKAWQQMCSDYDRTSGAYATHTHTPDIRMLQTRTAELLESWKASDLCTAGS